MALILGLTVQGVFAQDKVQDVIKFLQKKYDKINDFTADLLQIQEFGFSGAKDTTQLSIALLKKDYFKIKTADITIVTDGKIVQDYSISEKRVTIDYYEKSQNSILPREFLFEFPKRYSPVDFRREERYGSTGFILEMEPKKPDEEPIQALEVWIDAADSLVKYVRNTDLNDTDTIFILSNYKTDTGLTPKDFELKYPDGTKVINLTKKK
ncbi:hypothetical protein AMJ80_08415 [bacterium SM23_31]|nr:MAG: hypothetical protein AMJ80_08415 [bacterium SM23_31]